MSLKCVTTTLIGIPHKLMNRVFQTTSLEGNNWSASNEEFMLHNTSWFEKWWHEAKISTSVNKRSIIKEFIWSSPEGVWVSISELPHPIGTSGCIWLFHTGWTAYKELYLVLKHVNQVFSNIQNQMNTFLTCNSSYEGENWNWVIKFAEMEIFLLQ